MTKEEIEKSLEEVQFISPNEPITPQGIERILQQMKDITSGIEGYLGRKGKTISMWNPNAVYSKGDLTMYFRQEKDQVAPDVGKREFVFILVSLANENDSIPNYNMVDGIPDFTQSDWRLLNPMSYLLQDLVGMKAVVKEVFTNLLQEHVEKEHGLSGSTDIGKNLLRKDYSNLLTPWQVGRYSLVRETQTVSEAGLEGTVDLASNGVMECQFRYQLEAEANQEKKILDARYYYQRSPIWDESDQTIFSRKYTEDSMMSVVVNPESPIGFNHLRYGTNIFHKHIAFKVPFINDEYMVFFDTYGNGQFVFGYDRNDLQAQTEPTYDAVVSMPMLMNKTESGFDIVLPIHSYFNSLQKYNIGVPWNNVFTLQAIGRYR